LFAIAVRDLVQVCNYWLLLCIHTVNTFRIFPMLWPREPIMTTSNAD
jgi:hypothetical protein